jgi:hypothetical protein
MSTKAHLLLDLMDSKYIMELIQKNIKKCRKKANDWDDKQTKLCRQNYAGAKKTNCYKYWPGFKWLCNPWSHEEEIKNIKRVYGIPD